MFSGGKKGLYASGLRYYCRIYTECKLMETLSSCTGKSVPSLSKLQTN